MNQKYDVIIIGAGAAGLMSAIEAGKRGRSVLLVDHSKKIGEKIRISGGGRCNFTNLYTNPSKFISQNSNFMISALNQYTQYDFIELIKKYQIKFHEKKLGQLFCDESAQQIIDMLLLECKKYQVTLKKETHVLNITKKDDSYITNIGSEEIFSNSLIIATGGLSIPKMGATKFGYDIAKKFDIKVVETVPALVPLTFSDKLLLKCKELTGLSLDSIISINKNSFKEGMLFTHRGLSGPSILQISSYWRLGNDIKINLSPNFDIYQFLINKKETNPKQDITTLIAEVIPKRLSISICRDQCIGGNISELSNKLLQKLSNSINNWSVRPTGSEGYRTAEVTLGGIDTNELSSKTMMSKKHNGLYFVGEVVDVTGHLGGYNFQWAWSSGYVAGKNA